MKTGVRYNNISYIHNKKNSNHFVCIIDWSIDLTNFNCMEFLDFNKKFWDIVDQNNGWYDKKTNTINFSSKGIAKLNETDELFDKEFAKRLSMTRAQRHLFKISRHLYDSVIPYIMEEFVKPINVYSTGCEESAYKCDNHINELINNRYGK